MNRIQQPWAESIAAALDFTEEFRFENVDFLCGVDPIFVGLHSFTDTTDGRSYRSTTHAVPSFLANDGRTTVVLPTQEDWWTIVHELGHVLDERMGWQWTLPPVNDYAATDRCEAFACAFVTWVCGDGQPPELQEEYDLLMRLEPRVEEIFSLGMS